MIKNYQTFKKHLFNNKIDKKSLFVALKTRYLFEEQISVLKQLPKSFYGLVYGNSILKSNTELGRPKSDTIFKLEHQINWLCHQFKHFSSELSSFIKLRNQYEQSFLLGDYLKSEEILNEINRTISVSSWGIENSFLQIQYQKGLEFNFRLLNSSQTILKDNGYYLFLLHFFSFKVEEDISFFSYQNSLNNSFKNVGPHQVEYFNYRLNPLAYRYNSVDSLFWMTNEFSIIDKYLLMRDVLVDLKLTNQQTGVDDDFEMQVRFLAKYISDPLLNKLSNFNSDLIVKDEDFSVRIQIIDLYTKGIYAETISQSKNHLLKTPNDLGIIEIYVKSHIILDIPLEDVTTIPCFLNTISKLIYNYLHKGDLSNEAFVEILTLTNAISNFDFAKELAGFLEKNGNIENTSYGKGYFYSKTLNPLHYTTFKNINAQETFLKTLLKDNTSITLSFLLNSVSGLDTNDFKGIVPHYRITYYKSVWLLKNKQYEECKVNLESIFPLCTHIGYLEEILINNLFICYLQLDEFDLAIDLYVTSYLKNENLVPKIEVNDSTKKIIQQHFKNVRHDNINFPIFIYLTQNETHSKFIAYDLYLRSCQANRPTELINQTAELSIAHIFFLKSVCNSKIISRKVMVFKNSSEVIKERIAICQSLSKIDSKSMVDYNNEISELTQRLTVQQRIKEIDQSMIYVDENGIIGHELVEIHKSFNRFKSVSELLKLKKIESTGISYDALAELLSGNIDNDSYKKTIRKTDLHFDLFIQLFLEIRDKFLFSNYYGLDYYLSQRIRHGTIIGQIRKQFQELNLVTSKNSIDDIYLPNIFWSEKNLNLSGKTKEVFEQRMAEFSASIDQIITDLKDKYIQIRTEDLKTSQTGWFDYMYIPVWDRDQLYAIFISKMQLIADFQIFINSIFEILWDMTSQNLKRIRSLIDENVKVELIKNLDNLEVDLSDILTKGTTNPIFKNIADCRTNVQAGVDTVARWFNKSKSDEIDFTLADAFNTSLKIVNNINSPYAINFIEELEAETLFKGAYFPHFVDLLKIFITNIFNYYREHNILEQAGCAKFSIDKNILIIDFTNALSKDTDLHLLELKINKIKEDLLSSNYKGIRGEGKSGISKASNILKNVFRDPRNEIVIDVDDQDFKIKCIISIQHLLV